MTEQPGIVSRSFAALDQYIPYVKSPVASLCLVCSSVRCLLSVMISVLMASRELKSPLALGSVWAILYAVLLLLYSLQVKLVGRENGTRMNKVEVKTDDARGNLYLDPD